MKEDNVLLEVCIKPREFCDMDCKLLIIRNISHVARQEKLQSEYEYQQALIQTRQHEDLTPLNAILNMSEMLLDDQTITNEQRDFMQIIWSSGKMLEFNIQSQLSQMQIEQDSLEINYVECSRPELQEIIKDVLKPFHMVIKERNLQCQVNGQTSIPVQFFIEKKIYSEILYNLVQNAVKFNKPNGSIITTVRFDKETGKLWTTIEDTGVGINAQVRRNLFIAFRNATNEKKITRNHSGSGIGIGLSNSKCLVQALAGTIDLQSKPDKGTIVTFSVDIVIKKQKQQKTLSAVEATFGAGVPLRSIESMDEQLDPNDLAPNNAEVETPKQIEKQSMGPQLMNRDDRQKERAKIREEGASAEKALVQLSPDGKRQNPMDAPANSSSMSKPGQFLPPISKQA